MRSNHVFLAVSTLVAAVAAGTTPHYTNSPVNCDTIQTFCNSETDHQTSCVLGATWDPKKTEWSIGIYDNKCNKIGYNVDTETGAAIDSELPSVIDIKGLDGGFDGGGVDFGYEGKLYSTKGSGYCTPGGSKGVASMDTYTAWFECHKFTGTDQPGTPGLPNN